MSGYGRTKKPVIFLPASPLENELCYTFHSSSNLVTSLGMIDPCYLSITELSRRIQSRSLSPVDITQAFLDRIDRLNPALLAYTKVFSKQAICNGVAKSSVHLNQRKFDISIFLLCLLRCQVENPHPLPESRCHKLAPLLPTHIHHEVKTRPPWL